MEASPQYATVQSAFPLAAELRRWARVTQMLYLQRFKGFSVPAEPLFDPVSTPYFIEQLRESSSYLEFGSGGSTILATELGKSFVTVESDPYFLTAVRKKIRESGFELEVPRQKLLRVDIGLTEAWGVPVFQKRTPARLARWKRYATTPWEDGSNEFSPDLILVDGRFRVACALEAARRLRARADWTLLMDDYAERPHYRVVEEFLDLVQMVGRMAVFRPRLGADLKRLEDAIERHVGDFR